MTSSERGPFGVSLTVLLAALVVVAGFLVYAIRPHQEEPPRAEEPPAPAPASARGPGRPKGSKTRKSKAPAPAPVEAPAEPESKGASDDNPS